jgi:N-acyl-D-aspartate/D-glutamate deacylase
MAKLTIDERVNKIEKAIKKEAAVIVSSKERVKNLKKELKALTDEKNRTFANSFLEIIAESGFETDEQKKRFIELCAKAAKDIPLGNVSQI